MNHITLSPGFSIDATSYAVDRNAILGIPNSGKTYTATKIAEQLCEVGIPWIAFDPVGVWKYLRVGLPGKRGYQVVVVGGTNPDIDLDEDTIEDVVREALRNRISLVLDLFGNRNKSLWRRIIRRTGDLLLNENARYGPRVVFLEEAREFIPQTGNERGMEEVINVITSLATIGGNSSLGITIINQRAADVKKSVLELSSRMFLHQQTGRNDLQQIEQWFKVSRAVEDEDSRNQIMSSLPRLRSGECWVCSQSEHQPKIIQVSAKNTIHPDRKKPMTLEYSGKALDASEFVGKIKRMLDQKKEIKQEEEQKRQPKKPSIVDTSEQNEFYPQPEKIRELEQKVAMLQAELHEQKHAITIERTKRIETEKRLKDVQTIIKPQFEAYRKLFEAIGDNHQSSDLHSVYAGWIEKLGPERIIIQKLLDKPDHVATKQQLMLICKISRESVRRYGNKLIAMSLLEKEGDVYRLKQSI